MLPARPSGHRHCRLPYSRQRLAIPFLCIIYERTCLDISYRLLRTSIQPRVNPNKKYRCCDYEDDDQGEKTLFGFHGNPP